MLTGIHFILTYTCNFECDHCFLYCSPRAQGTFSIDQMTALLNLARQGTESLVAAQAAATEG